MMTTKDRLWYFNRTVHDFANEESKSFPRGLNIIFNTFINCPEKIKHMLHILFILKFTFVLFFQCHLFSF